MVQERPSRAGAMFDFVPPWMFLAASGVFDITFEVSFVKVSFVMLKLGFELEELFS